MTKTKRLLLRIAIIATALFIGFGLPALRPHLNQAMNKELIEKVSRDALSANIQVVKIKSTSGTNTTSTSTGPGGSGVIFRKEGNKYYALTAEHVIADLDGVIVLGHDDLDFRAHLNQGGKFGGIADYYAQFPKATVEYASPQYDLAVISFVSDEDFTVLPLADDAPKYGDKVAALSNPFRRRNTVTAGKISSRKPRAFGDNAGEMQHPIITHTAWISEGSSGSGLLNENLEIVGINLGGNENILRQFVSGMAMPSNLVHDFLAEWGK